MWKINSMLIKLYYRNRKNGYFKGLLVHGE